MKANGELLSWGLGGMAAYSALGGGGEGGGEHHHRDRGGGRQGPWGGPLPGAPGGREPGGEQGKNGTGGLAPPLPASLPSPFVPPPEGNSAGLPRGAPQKTGGRQ